MARSFDELRDRMTPDRKQRIDGQAREMMVEMLLAEIRKASGLTQANLAGAMGIRRPSLSRLESQGDMQISTLRRIIQALGGELELVARMPHGTIRLSQFNDGA